VRTQAEIGERVRLINLDLELEGTAADTIRKYGCRVHSEACQRA